MSARLTARDRLLRSESEGDFQTRVCAAAKLFGWWWHHHTISKYSVGGWPDLVLIRGHEAVFAELKKQVGRTTPVQDDVIAKMRAAGLEVHVWRPSDWEEIVARLRR